MEFNLADLFECVVDHVPDRTAVVCGDRRLTYAELDEYVNRFASLLASLDVAAGDHVGLYLFNDVEHLGAMLGCYKLRAVPINVNYRYARDEVRYVVENAELRVMVCDPTLADNVDMAEVLVLGAELEGLLASMPDARDFGPRSADDHYILYTGGTTGMPKGVVWRQEDIFFAAIGGGNPGGPPIDRPEEIGPALLANPNQRLSAFLPAGEPGPGEFIALSLGPLVHASGQWGALGTLLGGGTLVLNPDRSVDMAHVLELIERERIGMLTLVGDTSARPLLAALDAADGAHDTSSLRLIGSGGSILSADVKQRLLDALPSVVTILEAIGSSESPAQAVAIVTPDVPPTSSLTFASKPETMVVDDDLVPIPPGTGGVGRLATRGRVPLGYWNDPERTERTFVEIDGERWALPGDMATVDADGTIHLLGRGSLCINTGGEKVYPEEVEAVLTAHPKVDDAVVVGVPDEQWGQRVAAVVASAAGVDGPTLDDLQAHCRARLAGYKLPRQLHVVAQVRRSPSGKADYQWATAVARR
jgi:acyl-CoA synthetase (AMP-forming)/AMP-acid ligase II